MYGFSFSKKDQLLKILKDDTPISFISCASYEKAVEMYIKYLKEEVPE